MRVEPNRAYILRDFEPHQEVDAIRLAIADRDIDGGNEGPLLRKSAVWKFRSARRGTHFFATSSHLQSEMKGTVHPTEAHIGFSQPQPSYEKWVGPQPASRHLHTLRVRDLKDGEHQHIFLVHLPGFALMSTPQPFDPRKIVTWSNPHPPEFEVTFALTVVQGDWRSSLPNEEHFRTVGLLTGEGERHALISVGLAKYEDVGASIANVKRNLSLIPAQGCDLAGKELTAVLWMERQPDDPIRIIECSGVTAIERAANR